MYKIFRIELTILLKILVLALAEKNEEIAALEKEKVELFNQINNAIDESVKLLLNNNDSEAIQGVDFMIQLKDQLKVINSTDFKDLELFNDTRRSRLADKSFGMFDIGGVFKKAENRKNGGERKENEKRIRQKLDEWLLQKELEKKKILADKNKMKMTVKEKCPRFGLGDSGSAHDRNKQNKHKSKPKYPCCRKCCKNSYMGCL